MTRLHLETFWQAHNVLYAIPFGAKAGIVLVLLEIYFNLNTSVRHREGMAEVNNMAKNRY